ncbi:Hypothetical predicted protein [Scomber scombrus]|uniref:Uncharacterized protein n=1 Tax=Scomber scombrus TaxID=13677 RepID=A0AAV1N6C4_SCOSC
MEPIGPYSLVCPEEEPALPFSPSELFIIARLLDSPKAPLLDPWPSDQTAPMELPGAKMAPEKPSQRALQANRHVLHWEATQACTPTSDSAEQIPFCAETIMS